MTVKVFNRRLETTSILQVPATTFSELISYIGGLLGLWLGASALSLLEVGELLVDVGARLVGWAWAKRRVPKSNSVNAPPLVEARK